MDQREAVFEEGEQVRPDDDGTGLGLARVRAIIEALGGAIEARGNRAGGTDMVMRLHGAFILGTG